VRATRGFISGFSWPSRVICNRSRRPITLWGSQCRSLNVAPNVRPDSGRFMHYILFLDMDERARESPLILQSGTVHSNPTCRQVGCILATAGIAANESFLISERHAREPFQTESGRKTGAAMDPERTNGGRWVNGVRKITEREKGKEAMRAIIATARERDNGSVVIRITALRLALSDKDQRRGTGGGTWIRPVAVNIAEKSGTRFVGSRETRPLSGSVFLSLSLSLSLSRPLHR